MNSAAELNVYVYSPPTKQFDDAAGKVARMKLRKYF